MKILSFAVITIGVLILTSISLSILSPEPAFAGEKANQVDVRARAIHVTLPGGQEVTVYHLFIVYVKPGIDFVCQGFPFDPATGQIPKDSDLPLNLPSPYLLQGRCIPFGTDNRDFNPKAPSTTVVSGPDAKDAYKCFVNETKKFNDAKISYALLATNSNTYVRTILDKCDIPGMDSRLSPGVTVPTAPGWAIVLP
jgi:hypothetical protein